MAGVNRMSVGRMPMNYFMCSGKDPTEEYGENATVIKKFDPNCILVVISFIIDIFALAKIFLYKRKVEKGTQNIELGQLNNSAPANQRRNAEWNQNEEKKMRHIPKSLVDLTTYLLCITFNLIFLVIFGAMDKIEPSQLNKYENRWLAYFVQIIGFALAVLGIALQYYMRNFSAFKKLLKN